MPKLIPELKVLNFQKSLEFYVKFAEFEILYDRPEEEFAMISKNGAQIMIEGISSERRSWRVGALEYPLGRGVNFQIQVSDVNGLYENFKENKTPIFFEMEDKWYLKNNVEIGNRQFLVQDPDGYLLRFFQDLGERSL